jgi:hypothetical protein
MRRLFGTMLIMDLLQKDKEFHFLTLKLVMKSLKGYQVKSSAEWPKQCLSHLPLLPSEE